MLQTMTVLTKRLGKLPKTTLYRHCIKVKPVTCNTNYYNYYYYFLLVRINSISFSHPFLITKEVRIFSALTFSLPSI